MNLSVPPFDIWGNDLSPWFVFLFVYLSHLCTVQICLSRSLVYHLNVKITWKLQCKHSDEYIGNKMGNIFNRGFECVFVLCFSFYVLLREFVFVLWLTLSYERVCVFLDASVSVFLSLLWVEADPLGPLCQEAFDGVKGEGAKDDSAETEKKNTISLSLSPLPFSSLLFLLDTINRLFSWTSLSLPSYLSLCFFFLSACFLFIFHSLFSFSPSCGLVFLCSTFQLCVC